MGKLAGIADLFGVDPGRLTAVLPTAILGGFGAVVGTSGSYCNGMVVTDALNAQA